MKAIVVMSVAEIASLICVAASTLPPNVSISKIISSAPFFSAALIARLTKAGIPKSIVSCIGTT